MSAEALEPWLGSGLLAMINGLALQPLENPLRKNKPLSSQKGQAEAFFLVDSSGNGWILKKFHGHCHLDYRYLVSISALLPKDDGFACGTKRQVLGHGALAKMRRYYHSKDLEQWLEGTVLMPRINGLDWAALTDAIREGKLSLDRDQRLALCRGLTTLVELLEAAQCCHRDLSCGNVFIDLQTLRVYLIDFDSLYHPSLAMPPVTTCGTEGYTAHHAWNNDRLDAGRTWCPHADRYALALLNVEFLLVEPGRKATGEGGIFDQDEIRNQGGTGLDSIVQDLRQAYPQAAQLLQSTIRSTSFSDCPAPAEWRQLFDATCGPAAQPISLGDFLRVNLGRLADILRRCRPPAPLWPAPDLEQIPLPSLALPKKPPVAPQVSLPPDPWSKHSQRGGTHDGARQQSTPAAHINCILSLQSLGV